MKETLKKLRASLRPLYGDRETEAIIRIIFHYLKGWNLTDMLIHETEPLSPFIKEETDKILDRLLKHEPIQYITGEARFHGLELHVTSDVLIPRPETAELVDIITDDAGGKEDLKVLDIATGSGCIAVALARSLTFPEITALDISGAALDVARSNARELKTKVNFIEADIFSWPEKPNDNKATSNLTIQKPDIRDKKFDIIVSNPPYIDESEKRDMEPNVLDYEPHQALFVSDEDPLKFYRHIAEVAQTLLADGGRLYFEINPRHTAEMVDLLHGKGFEEIEIIRDSFGKERFVRCIHSVLETTER